MALFLLFWSQGSKSGLNGALQLLNLLYKVFEIAQVMIVSEILCLQKIKHVIDLLSHTRKLIPSQDLGDLTVLTWAHVGYEEANSVSTLDQPIALHAQFQKHMVVLLKLACFNIDICCVVDLSFANFSHQHHGLVLHEVKSLDFLQIREHGFFH